MISVIFPKNDRRYDLPTPLSQDAICVFDSLATRKGRTKNVRLSGHRQPLLFFLLIRQASLHYPRSDPRLALSESLFSKLSRTNRCPVGERLSRFPSLRRHDFNAVQTLKPIEFFFSRSCCKKEEERFLYLLNDTLHHCLRLFLL